MTVRRYPVSVLTKVATIVTARMVVIAETLCLDLLCAIAPKPGSLEYCNARLKTIKFLL